MIEFSNLFNQLIPINTFFFYQNVDLKKKRIICHYCMMSKINFFSVQPFEGKN